jgi:hypothetical protein
MLRTIIISLVALGSFIGLTGIVLPGTAQGGETHREMCSVVQAAFMAIRKSQNAIFPNDIEANSRPIPRIGTFFIPNELVTADERSDLISQQDRYSIEHFYPVCDWKGTPQSVLDEGTKMRVSFSNPVFSSDAKLVILELSFLSDGVWGYGLMCILRRADFDWITRCRPSWIR